MLHTCVQKFDVTKNLKNFWKLNEASLASSVASAIVADRPTLDPILSIRPALQSSVELEKRSSTGQDRPHEKATEEQACERKKRFWKGMK